ncbi:MAG: response regulator [Bacteroidetes bacterium]|nr:response regulator [Bacteroidota bacterium]
MNNHPLEIIIVEDDQNDYEITTRILKRRGMSGNIAWLKDGEEALLYFDQLRSTITAEGKRHPRIVILDIKLPKVLGFEVLKRIKEDNVLQYMPVIIFSSSNQERDLLLASQLHANSYIVKPVEYDAYAQSIDEMVTYWMFTHKFI